MSSIIVYFSRAGENYVNGAIRDIPVGNTQTAAQLLHQAVGGAIFQVEMQTPYSSRYTQCVAQAKADWQENARPAPSVWPDPGLDAYDTIYLAYPNYCGTMPMVLFTLLERYDLTGRTIRPLCTNEGSGLGRSVGDIQKLCPGAQVGEGLSVHGAEAAQSQALIRQWAEKTRG